MHVDPEDQGRQQIGGKSTQVLAAMARSPTNGTRRLSQQMGISQSSVMSNLRAKKWSPYKLQMGISQSSVMSNLRANKWRPYKLQTLQQDLTEDYPNRRLEFSEWTFEHE
ncbi:hypothetical protein AVEN_192736-1 [Araneus ventricosus]|uniref:HTH psq-type domain-containing protein n=1 Tax=Araneus ventricosus TaxID=182803 RepID=A0A4Y2KPJ6_ARAVE|nr:hypothetical protein AVEN_192736-1 [Araneus ventricosus]